MNCWEDRLGGLSVRWVYGVLLGVFLVGVYAIFGAGGFLFLLVFR